MQGRHTWHPMSTEAIVPESELKLSQNGQPFLTRVRHKVFHCRNFLTRYVKMGHHLGYLVLEDKPEVWNGMECKIYLCYVFCLNLFLFKACLCLFIVIILMFVDNKTNVFLLLLKIHSEFPQTYVVKFGVSSEFYKILQYLFRI